MSVHAFTLGDDSDGEALRIVLACHAAQRGPAGVDLTGTTLTLTFTPDLTAAETTALTELVRAAKSVLGLSRAERNALESDVTTLRSYLQVATPTLAQTAAATKAIIRVLRAVLRD